MECPSTLLQHGDLMDEVQQQIASLSSDLGMPARVEDRYPYELLAPVMVHIAILAHHTVRCLLGHGKTHVEHIAFCIN